MTSKVIPLLLLAGLSGHPLLSIAAEPASLTLVPEHYSLILAPNLDTNSFTGQEAIRIRLSGITRVLSINAADITFDDAQIVSRGTRQTAKLQLDKEMEMATLSLDDPVGPGEITIEIRYRGVLQDRCCGFYTVRTGGLTYGVILSSARHVFPSFDEPSMKATFDLSATIERSDQVVSNGKVVSDLPGPGASEHTVKFSTTPRMSPYLLTLAIGKFECESGQTDDIPIRVCGPPQDKGLGRSTLEAAEFMLHFYDQYFEMKYPYGKLDFVGLPGIPGAMENTACILALDSALFGDPDKASDEWLKNLAFGPVAHEMAHQWFGDLVTMKSPEESWLNEGMATWMAYKAVAAWKPDWKVEVQELVRTNAAMDADSLASTRPIRSLDAPDKITYDKAAAVLRMIDHYIGASAFRRAINSYVRHYAYSNVGSEDLWNEIAAVSGLPADRIMAGFVTQPGIPALSVDSRCEDNRTDLNLSQRRLFVGQSGADPIQPNLWQIPVCLRVNGGESCQLLSTSHQRMVINGCGPVYANVGAVGYYRSFYDSDNLLLLAETAESKLSAAERMNLVDDTWAAVRAGKGNIGNFLSLVKLFSGEPEPAVLKSIAADLAYVNDYIVADIDRSEYREWIRTTFAPRVQRMEWQSVIRETSELDLQAELLNIVGGIGREPELLQFSGKVAREATDGKARNTALRAAALRIRFQSGDPSLYETILARLRSSKNPQERIEHLESLARFENPQLIDRSVALDISGELSAGEARDLRASLFQNPAARTATWEFLEQNWDAVEKRNLVTRGLFGDLSQFCDSATGSKIDAFFQVHKLPDELKQPLTQALVTIGACNGQRQQLQPPLHIWLGENSALADH